MKLLLSHRALFALGALIPIALVAFAVVLTLGYDIAACPLCIAQRMLFLAVAAAALLGLLASAALPGALAAISMALFAGAGGAIAGYQLYLQQHPFTATCGDGTAWWERLVEQAGSAVPALFKAEGLCSSNAWSMFGISIVEWSLTAFCGLFLLALLALYSGLRNKKGRT